VNVRWLEADAGLGAARGEIVVCIPLYGGHEHFVRCLRSVLDHTPGHVRILICDDASPDTRSREFVARLEQAGGEHEVVYLRRRENVGFPANVNGALRAAAPADVVILNSDCVVSGGWIDGLRAAANEDSRIASATALTNNGTLVSVPEPFPSPYLPDGWTLDQAAAAVRGHSLRIRPRLLAAVGHCVLIRRSAIDLVGEFDLAFTPGYGEEVDFSQRCLHAGLSHVLADDVFIYHAGGASFSNNGQIHPVKEEHERLLAIRYPYYHMAVRAIEAETAGPLARARSVARRALKGLSVVIDARILIGPMTGTQLQVLEVISALARTEKAHIKAIVPDVPGSYAHRTLASLPDVELVTRADVLDGRLARADLLHRPYQIDNEEDVSFLAPLAERLVVTNQDLIAYHNPSYFQSYSKWQGFRRTTATALAVADRVVFVSEHARDEALAEELLEPARASVVHNGVDHALLDAHNDPEPPRGAERLPEGAETILCIGTDFRHKNRVFALRLLAALQTQHGWDGRLLLVGPRVTAGSSAPEEAEILALHPNLVDAVIDFASVSEAEKSWLFQRARLVLYPTVHEGFGLVPFEAAERGVPCLWAAGTSLAEVLPPEAGEIVSWDPTATAEPALALLRDEEARARNLAAISAAAARFTWDAAAAKLLEVYELTCDTPAAPAGALERRGGLMGGVLSEDAMRLLGPGGALPVEMERPLLALATHPQVSKPMFRAIKFGYKAGYVWRRRLLGGGSPERDPDPRASPRGPARD